MGRVDTVAALLGRRFLRPHRFISAQQRGVEPQQQSRAYAGVRCQGFRQREYGLEWFPNKEALLKADHGPVVVASSYQYMAGDRKGVRQVRKYSSFASHCDYWDFIDQYNHRGVFHNLHEVFLSDGPRCLYFDLDGNASLKEKHSHIVAWLQQFVRWFFSGDRMSWDADDPNAVILTSSDPAKYSCHVVFPQIQFRNYSEQQEYISVLLSSLPALQVNLEGGESEPILSKLVDPVPYTNFQLFRGPYACKMGAGGHLRSETRLEPEGYFRSDPRTCFAGHVDADRSLRLPPLDQLLSLNEEVRHFHKQKNNRLATSSAIRDSSGISLQDANCLYRDEFQMTGGGILDFSGLSDLQVYEQSLEHLHPERASQWWSWFRISSITYSMLRKYKNNDTACARIWKAHHAWSSKYPHFDEQENVDMVMRCEVAEARGRTMSSLPTLLNVVRFDNPDMQVRETAWKYQTMSSYHRGGQSKLRAGTSARVAT